MTHLIDPETTEYERTTIVDGYTIEDMRKVTDRIFNPSDWKAPWAAAVPAGIVDLVCKAVEFFHADKPTVVGIEPITGKVLMEGRGYQAW